MPSEMWHSLFSRASAQVDILVYAGGFLLETLDLIDVLQWKASAGRRVRVLIGDPRSDAVKIRSDEISLPWLPDRCQTTVLHLDAVRRKQGVSVRQHGTTLYASTFGFDDVLLVNTHAVGIWSAQPPTLQVRQSSGSSLFDFYSSAFERVWTAFVEVHHEMRSNWLL